MEGEQTQTKAERMAEDASSETKSQGNAEAAVAVENQVGEMELNATVNERAGKEETVYSDVGFWYDDQFWKSQLKADVAQH